MKLKKKMVVFIEVLKMRLLKNLRKRDEYYNECLVFIYKDYDYDNL